MQAAIPVLYMQPRAVRQVHGSPAAGGRVLTKYLQEGGEDAVRAMRRWSARQPMFVGHLANEA